MVKQIPIKNKTHLKLFLKEIEQKGGEGVVVRDPNAPYIDKRSNKALKVKTFHDTECQVVGYSEGKGKYKNMLGAIECQIKNGIRFKIGAGLSNKLRVNSPKIGAVATFKYQSFTKHGKPRFPVFLRVKNV